MLDRIAVPDDHHAIVIVDYITSPSMDSFHVQPKMLPADDATEAEITAIFAHTGPASEVRFICFFDCFLILFLS